MKRIITIISWIALLLITLLVIRLYLGIRGQTEYAADIGPSETEMLTNELNISLSPGCEIKSFAYMTYMVDSFYVPEIKTDNAEKFLETNKNAFGETTDKLNNSLLFPTKKYLPKCKGVTAYYTSNTVYLSLWSWEYPAVSDIFFSIDTEN